MQTTRKLGRGNIYAAALAVVLLAVLFATGQASATNHQVMIDEVMAGANGTSSIQFIEMRMCCGGQNAWGPQGSETTSRARLVFFDAGGTQTGEFRFPNNPPSGSAPVLIATQAFADLPEYPVREARAKH